MAPEEAAGLEVLTLQFEDRRLAAHVETLQSTAAGQKLEIFWHAEPREGMTDLFWKVGNGIAYVRRGDHILEPRRRKEYVSDDSTWWPSGDVVIVTLPPELTAIKVLPPAQAKDWNGQLGLLWHVQDVSVQWVLDEYESLDAEVERINRDFFDWRPPPDRIQHAVAEATALEEIERALDRNI